MFNQITTRPKGDGKGERRVGKTKNRFDGFGNFDVETLNERKKWCSIGNSTENSINKLALPDN
jgi:hypothetical protein